MGVKKNKTPPQGEIDTLKSEVAEFASSIGLSTSASSSGFNDVDFRKTRAPAASRPSNKSEKPEKSNPVESTKLQPRASIQSPGVKKIFPEKAASKHKNTPKLPAVKATSDFADKIFGKHKDMPKLPLMKANALGVWYTDAAELEDKLLKGEEKKKVDTTNLDKQQKELGDRLLAH